MLPYLTIWHARTVGVNDLSCLDFYQQSIGQLKKVSSSTAKLFMQVTEVPEIERLFLVLVNSF